MKSNFVFWDKGKFWFLLIVCTFFFLFRFPSFFEPLWYGDEGIYQVIGMSLNEGRLLYTQTWDNKPPLLYVLYALTQSDQFSIRVLSTIFGTLSIIIFFQLVCRLFQEFTHPSKKILIYGITTLYAFLFGLPLIEGNIANAENFMLLPIIGAALLTVNSFDRKNSQKFLVSSGILLGIAFLFKIVAVFDTAAFFLFLYVSSLRKNLIDVKALMSTVPFCIGFFIPVLSMFFYFLITGTFSDFIRSVFLQMFGYVNYGNKLLIPQGLLVIKLALLGSATWYIYKKKDSLSKPSQFILLWFFFSLFNAFFAQRPYTHYLLVLLPSFLLFIGLIFLEKKYQSHLIILLIFSLLILFNNFKLYDKTFSYYQNFASYMLNKKDAVSYRNFFDKKTDRNYQIASYLKMHLKSNDTVFLWGNSAQIYTLLRKTPPGRFAVAYHMASSKQTLLETESDLAKAKPKFIIIESDSDFPPFKLDSYIQKLQIKDSVIFERYL